MSDPVLRLSLLGAPVAAVAGAPLEVDTRKATALLAYLAVEEGAHARDSLAALLWPDYAPDRARAALRRTLSTLRTALGGDWLRAGRETVSLDRARLDLDVEEFRRLAAAGSLDALTAAAALHRGPFMAGFGLRDSVAFDDWQGVVGGALDRELGAVLDRLVDGRAAAGDWPRALEHAQRRLTLDPLHEPAHRRLMELYAQNGERGAALEQYRDCVRILHRELGVAPLEATTASYRAIREGSGPVSTVTAPPPAATAEATQHALTGRAREWSAIAGTYAEVGPDGRLLVLEGEAGIGKTRLGAELLAWARTQGAVAIGIRCFEDESALAYGSAIELLRAALRDGDPHAVDAEAASEAARLLPELGTPPTPSLDDPGAQARFLEGLATTLVAATAGERPAVVLADDAHWADAASLDLLAYLARRLRTHPVLLAVTWRPEEVPAAHPARRLLAEAARDGLARTVSPARLTQADVAALAGAAGAPAELAARLYEETEGLPFFVVEYLDSLADGAGEWPLPAGVRGLLESRIAVTSELGGQVLTAAAVLGRAFDAETVRGVSGRSDEEVVGALEELGARGLVDEGAGGTYDFRHEQLRKVAYDRTSLGRRRLLHRRAAAALAGGARGGATAGVVGNHLRLAGREAEAAEWFRLAGEHAVGLFANAEALVHFREALALGHPEPASLHAAIGDLQTLAGDYADALASYEAAAALDGEELAAIEHRIGLVHHRRGDWQLADDSFAEALRELDGAANGLRARVLADRSLNEHRRGADEAARSLATEALAAAEAAADTRALAQAHNILGILAAGSGDRSTARAHLEQSLELADGHADPAARAAALNNLALDYRAGGELDRALELTEEARRLCATVGDRHREAALTNNLADLLHEAGRRDDAMARLKEAVGIFAEIGEDAATEPEIWKLREW